MSLVFPRGETPRVWNIADGPYTHLVMNSTSTKRTFVLREWNIMRRGIGSCVVMQSTAVEDLQSNSRKKLPGCWRCGDRDPSMYACNACGTIQPPPKDCLDAFAMFGYNQGHKGGYTYDIPLDELEQKYKTLQKSLHPDAFSSASEQEKQFSAEQSALVNRAYATLKDPLSRGSHLLSLLTEQGEEEGEILGGLPHHPEMLEAIMEWREKIEDADDEVTLMALKDTVDGAISTCVEKLKNNFDSAERDLDQAKEELRSLRYVMRMKEAIVHKL